MSLNQLPSQFVQTCLSLPDGSVKSRVPSTLFYKGFGKGITCTFMYTSINTGWRFARNSGDAAFMQLFPDFVKSRANLASREGPLRFRHASTSV